MLDLKTEPTAVQLDPIIDFRILLLNIPGSSQTFRKLVIRVQPCNQVKCPPEQDPERLNSAHVALGNLPVSVSVLIVPPDEFGKPANLGEGLCDFYAIPFFVGKDDVETYLPASNLSRYYYHFWATGIGCPPQ